jgi:hypothetical protein
MPVWALQPSLLGARLIATSSAILIKDSSSTLFKMAKDRLLSLPNHSKLSFCFLLVASSSTGTPPWPLSLELCLVAFNWAFFLDFFLLLPATSHFP